MHIGLDVGLAAERSDSGGDLLVGEIDGGLRLLQVELDVIKRRVRVDPLLDQLVLAIESRLADAQRRLGRGELRLGRAVRDLHLLNIDPRRSERRIGLVEGNPVGFGVDGEEHIAGLDCLVLADLD